ncbi:DUF4055 domain-containing protein [Pseudomonas tolaasii]|uniref:DUF4055 domain-containing protein n=1 Tax=Pseudomonas tolaasii TaxID=29442 RepID=A0A7Y8DNU2_PSETO|nr:DUF4055 domain-containing protein [Pseudomonas tolaasii]NWC20355.1 DUF4055 domain-containing protein [Pseudomonas tolaasii]NWC38357.1 DUF4055 domain-containing protein [Pseudomonas tolaasii]NWD35808.1 DUF4055 domain-containing protein [Pseudomonas tolaasii]
MPNYSAIRQEYSDALPGWQLVKRCVAGPREIRKHNEYLPMPDPLNLSAENLARYEQLKKRAMFLNVVGRTRSGLLGAVFRKTAEIELPSAIEYLVENLSGNGASLEQVSKESTGECLDTGRGGFLTDFPRVELPEGQTALTVAQAANARAYIHLYCAESIVNWREDVIDGVRRLTLVVLHEKINEPTDDGFEFTAKDQYRALMMRGGRYVQTVYSADDPEGTETEPTDKAGKPFDHIPFHFFGSENNDASIDKAPLEDLAEVNILHYGNSATVEEAGFITSQPSLFITTSISPDEFVRLNPNGMHIGSRRGHNLGAQGSATLVQAKETQLARELMKDKEEQMLMIGARIVQQGSGAETAEAVRIRYSSDNSVLGAIAGNVSEAMRNALFDAQRFMAGEVDEKGTVFWLNQEFFDEVMDAQMILAQMQLWQQGIIAKKDFRTNLRQAAIVESDRSDDDIDADREDEEPVVGSEPDPVVPTDKKPEVIDE